MISDNNQRVISELTYHALLNKYKGLTLKKINNIVTELYQCMCSLDENIYQGLSQLDNKETILNVQQKVFHTLSASNKVQEKFYSDARNQAFVLCTFQIGLVECTVSNNFLEFIYRLLFFQKHIEWRNSHFVSDFGGLVPTTTIEMEQELPSLRKLLIQTTKLADNSKDSQSQALANCYAKIIRLHPFKDGNGRIARIIIEFFLIRWSYEMVIIPKVRNDVTWKKSLTSALNGDYHLLSAWFYDRMKKISKNEPCS